jgi:hypothetical protein
VGKLCDKEKIVVFDKEKAVVIKEHPLIQDELTIIPHRILATRNSE